MTISSSFASNSIAIHKSMAMRFQTSAVSQTSAVFTQNSVGFVKKAASFQVNKSNSMQIGFVATQFQAMNAVNNAAKSKQKFENWCISDHYKVSLEETLPALRKLQEELKFTDFTGKTDIEIYNHIEKRFIDVFGEDFKMAQYLGLNDPKSNCPDFNNINSKLAMAAYSGNEEITAFFLSLDRYKDFYVPDHIREMMTMQESTNFRHIANAFDTILRGHFSEYVGGYDRTRDINRERLYGDMSTVEIMDAIRAKYPEMLTNRDVALMTSEMYDVGIMFPIKGLRDDQATELNADGTLKRVKSQNEQNEIWLKMLDMPYNPIPGLKGYNNTVKNGNLCKQALEFRDFNVRFFGAVLGPDGLFVINEALDIDLDIEWDLTKMIPDLEEDFIETLENHDREIYRIREINNTDHERNRVKAVYEDSSLTPRRKTGIINSAISREGETS